MIRDMDPDLWNSLPTPLVELTISKLPFLNLIRLRLVCKSWNSLILSAGFSPTNPNPKSLLLSASLHGSKPSVISYNMVKACWHTQYLDCPSLMLNLDFCDLKLVATGGGLLCFEISPSTDQNFIVCNPLTRKWKRLPCMESHPRLSPGTSVLWRAAGLACDENSRSYKLVVAGFCPEDRDEGQNWFLKGTQIYDSVNESWTLIFQDREIMGGNGSFKKAFSKSLFCRDHIYVATSMDFACGHDVAIFSMKKGTWIEVSAFDFTVDDCPAYLVEYEDQVLLVAEELQDTYIQTFGFWKLNIPDMEAMWSQYHTDNQDLWMKLKSVARDQLPLTSGFSIRSLNWVCVGHKNSISFLFCTKKFWRPFDTVLVHDLCEDSWRALQSTESSGLEDSCAFQPSLSAAV